MTNLNDSKSVLEADELEDGEVAGEGQMTESQLNSYIDEISTAVRSEIGKSTTDLTPWFFQNMPKVYYQTTPRSEKIHHLTGLIAAQIFESKQTIELWEKDRTKVTFLSPGGDRQVMIDMARRMANREIKLGGIYTSNDDRLVLSTFFCSAPTPIDVSSKRILDKVERARKLMLEEFPQQTKEIDHFLKNLDNDLVIYATAARLANTYRMVQYMLTHESAHSFLDTFENSPTVRLTLGVKVLEPEKMLEQVLHLMHRYDFNLSRAFTVKLSKGYEQPITIVHLIMNHATEKKVTREFVPLVRMVKALRSLGWVDIDEYSAFTYEPYNLSINAANLVRSLGTWCHLFLSKQNPYAYSPYRVFQSFTKYADLTAEVVEVFRNRFDPMRADERKNGADKRSIVGLEAKIDALTEEIDRHIFRESLNFIKHCLKTNYFLNTKSGHAFRIDPAVLDERYYKEKPFGIFYITGRNFRFFQVRWKDISRGGLRVVMPRTLADHDYALAGEFDEVYGLSYAQQLKNKDIPEGGSKAVLVLKPGGHRDRAVKSAINALLDLLVQGDEAHESKSDRIISYYDKSEIIYLGPDENVTNELINWIPEQAARRGYRYAAAFMSSKPGAGINHKEFGVTSEGLNVYVENMLNFLRIDPRQQKFTIKMTGGPDGDVAGNELKILHREFGENPRVVSISDGYGCAFDPNGLDWKELLRLVETGQSIVAFDKAKLSKSAEAFVIAADTNENIKKRNELAMRVEADIFIPAGGRPYTVNDKNWQLFLRPSDKKPTMRAIVEGANIFFTAEARERLQEHGVYIIKDSSANKTGVICSSYEIIASLVLTAEEFTLVKPRYVREVLAILRSKADAEAKLLFRTYTQSDGQRTLVHLSMEISKEINMITDVLLEELTKDQAAVLKDPFYHEVVLRHCPPLMQEKYRQRLLDSLPDAHKIAIIASAIASFVVYREGLGWLKNIPKEHWFTALRIYVEKDQLTHNLVQVVDKSDISEKYHINAILARSAARDLTILELQKRFILR